MSINWPIPGSIGQIHVDPKGTKWKWNGKAQVSLGTSYDLSDVNQISELWVTDKIVKQIESSTINKEKVIGDIDGINKKFFLSCLPIKDSEHLYFNGILQENDAEDGDYTINGYEIDFLEAPLPGSRIRCTYVSLKRVKNMNIAQFMKFIKNNMNII